MTELENVEDRMTKNKTSRRMGSAAGLVLCVGLTGCGGSSGSLNQTSKGQLGTTSAQYGPLLVTLTALNTVTPGAIEPIGLTVQNVSHSAVTVDRVPGPSALVTHNGQEVWNDGNGVAFPAVVETMTLVPGQTRAFSAVWTKVNNEDPANPAQPVAPGFYVLKAWEVMQINGQTVTDAGHTAPPITVTVE